MRATYGLACALTTAIAAASAQATFIHFDLNAITVSAGEAFDGETHSGTLVLGASAVSSLNAIELDGVSTALSDGLGSMSGEIVLLNGAVLGGYIAFTADDGAEYIATIASGAGAVDTQAGRGFRVDGLTETGVLDNLSLNGTSFAGVDISKMLPMGDPVILDGSFLLHGYGPDAGGFDGFVDLDVYADAPVPSPGPAALALTAACLGGTRRRRCR